MLQFQRQNLNGNFSLTSPSPSSFLVKKFSLFQLGLGILLWTHHVGPRAEQGRGDCYKLNRHPICLFHDAYFLTGELILGKYITLFSQSLVVSVQNKEFVWGNVKDTKASNRHLSSIYFYAKNSAKYLGHKDIEGLGNGRERIIHIIMWYVLNGRSVQSALSTSSKTSHLAKLAGMGGAWGKFLEKVIGTSRWTREENASQEKGELLQTLQSQK